MVIRVGKLQRKNWVRQPKREWCTRARQLMKELCTRVRQLPIKDLCIELDGSNLVRNLPLEDLCARTPTKGYELELDNSQRMDIIRWS